MQHVLAIHSDWLKRLCAGVQVPPAGLHDADTLTFRIYLQPGWPDGPADATAYQSTTDSSSAITRAGQGLGLQVFPGSVTHMTHVVCGLGYKPSSSHGVLAQPRSN